MRQSRRSPLRSRERLKEKVSITRSMSCRPEDLLARSWASCCAMDQTFIIGGSWVEHAGTITVYWDTEVCDP